MTWFFFLSKNVFFESIDDRFPAAVIQLDEIDDVT